MNVSGNRVSSTAPSEETKLLIKFSPEHRCPQLALSALIPVVQLFIRDDNISIATQFSQAATVFFLNL